MKPIIFAAIAAVLLIAPPAHARDTRHEFPLQDLVDSQLARDAGIDGSVRFYLAGQPVSVTKRFGQDIGNRKTNAVNKSDEYACQWAALSVLRAFQEGAKSRGANAVVDIVSYYKKNEFRSTTNFECHAGAIMAGVALKGTYATVK